MQVEAGRTYTPENYRPWFAHYEPEVPPTVDIPDVPLHGLLESTVRDYPTNIATIFYGRRLTYAQLDDQANRFASGLQALGVGRGDRVAIILPNCPQFVIALFGVLKAGAVAVPTNPLYTPRELRNQFNDADIATVIALNTVAPRVQEIMPDTPVRTLIVTDTRDYLSPLMGVALGIKERRETGGVRVEGEGVYPFLDMVRNNGPDYERADMSPEDTAIFLYTGGTTGTPKAAMLSHRNLVANSMQMSGLVWDARPEKHEVFLGVIPFFHSYGLTVVMNFAVAVAGAMVLVPRFNMKEVLRCIARFRPTIFPAVPTMYNAIAHHPLAARYDLRSIRVCISGAAPLPMEVAHAFESVTGARLVEGYGLTETSPVTHCNPIYGERRDGSIGLPIPSTDARIVDPNTFEPLPVGEVGELELKGPQVMQGYWGHSEETTEKLQDGWFFTGDMARQDSDGYFYIVDRKRDLIIVGGFSVFPRDVEMALYECDKVQETVVMGVPDRRMGEVVKAYVVLKQGAEASEAELHAFCKERLAPFKVPKRIEFRESLPKSAVGKYLRRELLREELERRA